MSSELLLSGGVSVQTELKNPAFSQPSQVEIEKSAFSPHSVHEYRPVGSNLEMFKCKDPEVLLSGAAGTGKSRACLEKLHLLCLKYPGIRCIIVRKTQESLAKSALVTFQEHVVPEALLSGEVKYFGGSVKEPPAFKYASTSTILTGGMDKASRVMSSEYDVIYVQEATELDEEDWEMLTTRLRNYKMPYQQMIADCNPSHPSHWLKKRADAGKTHIIYAKHEDNPMLFTNGSWTDIGKTYMASLDALSGVRKERLRYGRWAAAEGLIYDTFDQNLHITDRFKFPKEWDRFWSVDFGYTNPFVCQMWVADPDGRLYLNHEVYMTSRTVQEHCETLRPYTKHRPQAVVCDWANPEDMEVIRKTLHVNTVKARKDVASGIQLVKERMKPQDDGLPRLTVCKNALIESDRNLMQHKKPLSTADEFLAYAWSTKKPDEPSKQDDHGMDAMRYMVMHLDSRGTYKLRFLG